jgi:hypothetical protein
MGEMRRKFEAADEDTVKDMPAFWRSVTTDIQALERAAEKTDVAGIKEQFKNRFPGKILEDIHKKTGDDVKKFTDALQDQLIARSISPEGESQRTEFRRRQERMAVRHMAARDPVQAQMLQTVMNLQQWAEQLDRGLRNASIVVPKKAGAPSATGGGP